MNKAEFIEIYKKEAILFDTILDDVFLKSLLQKNNINYGSFLLFFPAGQKDVIRYIFNLWNEEVLNRIRLENMRFSEKVETILNLKVKIAAENEKLFGNIFRTLLKSNNADLALDIVHKDTNFILDLAEDRSTDFTYYTKRLTLSLVYSATFFVFFKTKNFEKTTSFVARRISNIVSFTKKKNNFMSFFKKV